MLCFAQLHNNEKENNKSEKQKHFIISTFTGQTPHTTTRPQVVSCLSSQLHT